MSHGVLGHDPTSRGQFSSLDRGAAENAGLVHTLLPYRCTDDYLDGILRFVRHGVAVGEPVLVAVPGERVELLRARLGALVVGVRFADMADAGRNPGRIIPQLLCRFVGEHRTGRSPGGQRVGVAGSVEVSTRSRAARGVETSRWRTVR